MWNCWELILGPKKNPVWRIWRNFLRACIRDLSFLLFLSKFLKAWLSLGLLWQACYKGPFLGAYLRLCYNRGVPPWGKKPVQVREILFPSCLELDWPLVSCKFWVCSSLLLENLCLLYPSTEFSQSAGFVASYSFPTGLFCLWSRISQFEVGSCASVK